MLSPQDLLACQAVLAAQVHHRGQVHQQYAGSSTGNSPKGARLLQIRMSET